MRYLIQSALRLDPNCVGAIEAQAFLEAQTRGELIAGLERAVEAGERALGAEYFDEHRGDFWKLPETRPYMEALNALAINYKLDHRYNDAIEVYERMMDLNPFDDQCIRYRLLLLYLTVRNQSAVRTMMAKMHNDNTAFFAWSRVLERLLAGDNVAAAVELNKARQANPYVEQYLIEKIPLPGEPPPRCALGSREEAELCVFELFVIWKDNKEAFYWIFDQLNPGHSVKVASSQLLP
ncbi:MAG TPA: hypothetical protein VFU48_08320 [Nitrospira sp.]|nr:hypothetical protein [Nitrospira sp.]